MFKRLVVSLKFKLIFRQFNILKFFWNNIYVTVAYGPKKLRTKNLIIVNNKK